MLRYQRMLKLKQVYAKMKAYAKIQENATSVC